MLGINESGRALCNELYNHTCDLICMLQGSTQAGTAKHVHCHALCGKVKVTVTVCHSYSLFRMVIVRLFVSTGRAWKAAMEGQPRDGPGHPGFVIDIDVCSRTFNYFDMVDLSGWTQSPA